MKEFWDKVLEKIDLKIIIRTIYIGTLIFVFLPEKYIETLGLLDFKNTWKTVISSAFLLITCYYVAVLIEVIYQKIKDKFLMIKLNEIMKKLSLEEKQYLVQFYNHETKKFNTSNLFNISDAVVNLLVAKTIISRGSNIATEFTTFDYYLQPWAQEYLEKKLKNKTLVIEMNRFTWKD